MMERYADLDHLSDRCALTKEQVLWARAIYKTRCYPVKELSKALNVHPMCLYNAVQGGNNAKREPLIPLVTRAPEWIPCKERLPETKEYVLVTYRNGTVDKDFYDGEMWAYEDTMGDVIAWQELPEPYKTT